MHTAPTLSCCPGLCYPSLTLDCSAGPLTHPCIPSFPSDMTTKSGSRSEQKTNAVLLSRDNSSIYVFRFPAILPSPPSNPSGRLTQL